MSTKRLWHTPTTGDSHPTREKRYPKGQVRPHPIPNLAAEVNDGIPYAEQVNLRQPSPQSTFLQGDSPVSPSLLPGSAAARQTTVSSGRKCCASLRSSGPVGCLLRTLLESSTWHSTTCYLTWRDKATKRGRLYFQLVPSTPRTGETGCGLWATPQAADAAQGAVISEDDQFVTLKSGRLRRINRNGVDGSCGLAREVAVRLWPTPASQASGGPHGLGGGSGNTKKLRNMVGEEQGKAMASGQLNPNWVEWLMGYPAGWTALDASATPSSRRSRTKSSGASHDAQ
jgi:hypothetical protein